MESEQMHNMYMTVDQYNLFQSQLQWYNELCLSQQNNYNLNLRKKSCVYIKCNLFPLKEIMKNNTIKFISSTPPTDMNIAVDTVTKVKVKAASNTEEIKPKKL